MGKVKLIWYIVLIFVLVAAFGIYRYIQSTSAADETTHTIKRENLQETLALSGEIAASEEAKLHFQSGGRLSWVGVKEGDIVQKYQGIASLDQRQLQKTLQKYLNTYSTTRSDFDQTQDDNDELSIALSQTIRDRAKRVINEGQANLSNAVLDVELQTIAKEYAYLYSPINGVVVQADATEPGMNVSVTDMYHIINPNSLYFSLTADQTEVIKLREGMTGKMVFDAYPDQTIEGTITAISFTPQTDETGTVYEVRMAFTPRDNNYRIGMTGDVEFILQEIPNTIAIPSEYLIEEDDKQYVYKQVNNKKEKVEVTIGDEYDGLTHIKDGLNPGDIIYEVK